MARRKLPEKALEYFREQGRKGGLKGGKLRLEKISPERRKAIAKKAAEVRWGKKLEKQERTRNRQYHGGQPGAAGAELFAFRR